MSEYILTPKVHETNEFIEIANDFSNPLEIVREAISNAYDANAFEVTLDFSTIQEAGEAISVIEIHDNGDGMDEEGLQAFFDLGNSLNREKSDAIGEKGHGTKVYFNSKSIEVSTVNEGTKLLAFVKHPYKTLFDGELPKVNVNKSKTDENNSTTIIIKGYQNNRRDKFTHGQIKDYIYWFTKFGSVELMFGTSLKEKFNKIILKGLDKDVPEVLDFGHVFPEESISVGKLFDEHYVRAPDYYCKHVKKSGHLPNFPEIKYDAIFSIEGTKVKHSYNPMIRRRGYTPPTGGYSIQERYGLWLCKDFIPIQRKNEWVTFRGSEFTKFHAFFNCQGFSLTANRGSVENTPSEIMNDVHEEVKKIHTEIITGDYWSEIEWLEEESHIANTIEREKSQFARRIKKAREANITKYEGHILVQPERESGVFALLIQLELINSDIFPFSIVDYDTHEGLDVIVKSNDETPIIYSSLTYVELKNYLTKDFNHSFENLHSIVCWDTEIKHDEIVVDIAHEERIMKIIAGTKEGDYTRYFLDRDKSSHKIEVFVLKDYLKEKLNLEFRPRPEE
jgi:hypothetical protein